MQVAYKDGSVMLCGGCSKDAELQLVGERQSRKCTVGLAVGKRDDQVVWANVVAWHNLASILCTARKGDPVFVIGRLETREYNGKTYTDLIAEFVSVCSLSAVTAQPTSPQIQDGQLQDLDEDDSRLPF